MLNPDPNPDARADTDLVTKEEAQAMRQAQRRPSPWWVAGKTVISAILAVVIVAGAVTVMQRLIAARPDVPQRPAIERQVPVLTQTANVATHSPTISVFGEIVAGRLVDLRALVAGEITATHPDLEAGRRMMEGAPLVEIDRFAYEGAVVEAQANLTEAQARLVELEAGIDQQRDQLSRAEEQVDLAQRDLERASQLANSGSLTDRDLDNRRLTVSQRQQSVEQLESGLTIQEARVDQQRAALDRLEWRVAQAQRDLERTVLNAPFTGVIRSESVEVGRLVSVNDVIATLYDDSALNVRFTLSDSQFGRLASEPEPLVGRAIAVTWSTGAGEVELTGTVDRLDADISAATGGVTLFGSLDPDQFTANLRPGAFVSVAMADQAFTNTVRIPETALYNTDHVFVVVEERLQRRDVELVAWDGAFALIRAQGDAGLENAEIVTSRLTDAGDGVAVRRISNLPESNAGTAGGRPEGARPDGARPEGARPEAGRAQ